MKLNSLKITTTIIILISVILPSIIVSQYLLSSIRKTIKKEAYNEVSRVRDEKINQIKDFYFQEFHDIEKIISYISITGDDINNKDMKYLLDFQPNIKQVVLYDYNFKPLINVSREGFLKLDSISEQIRITLQKNFYFSKYFLKNIVLPDNSSELAFFYKDIITDQYLSMSLEYSYLDKYIKEIGPIIIDIYNDNSQIVSSSREEYDSRKVINNPIVEKMKLGLSENVLYKRYYQSYSHIDIGGESLYVNVSIPKSFVENKSKYLNTYLIIIYFIYLLFSLLISSLLVRFFYSIKESEIRSEIFSNRFSFFYRLKNSLSYIDKKFVEVQRLNKAINYFKNDISIILQDIPNKSEDDEETELDK
ncbi:MAG: hypothetical protein OCD02_15650 [Spirochaetaceae bacterium]